MGVTEIIDFALGSILVMVGWIVKIQWEQTRKIEKQQDELERYISDTYIRRDDYHQDMEHIKSTLARIENKIDQKADK